MTKLTSTTTPSLLDAKPTHAAPSMLSSLDATTKKRQTINGKYYLFRAVGIIIVCAAIVTGIVWGINNNTDSTIKKPANTLLPTSAAIAMPPPSIIAKIPSISVAPAAPQTATIVTDQPDAIAQNTVTAPVNDPQGRLKSALADTPVATHSHHSSHLSMVKKSRIIHHSVLIKSHHIVARSTKSKRYSTDEGDVKLLAALVSSSPDTLNDKTSHTANNTQNGHLNSSDANASNRNQDIVERKPGDSTASLLQRCAKLGLFEGQLCRWRICSGRWDSDMACKGNAQDQSASTNH